LRGSLSGVCTNATICERAAWSLCQTSSKPPSPIASRALSLTYSTINTTPCSCSVVPLLDLIQATLSIVSCVLCLAHSTIYATPCSCSVIPLVDLIQAALLSSVSGVEQAALASIQAATPALPPAGVSVCVCVQRKGGGGAQWCGCGCVGICMCVCVGGCEYSCGCGWWCGCGCGCGCGCERMLFWCLIDGVHALTMLAVTYSCAQNTSEVHADMLKRTQTYAQARAYTHNTHTPHAAIHRQWSCGCEQHVHTIRGYRYIHTHSHALPPTGSGPAGGSSVSTNYVGIGIHTRMHAHALPPAGSGPAGVGSTSAPRSFPPEVAAEAMAASALADVMLQLSPQEVSVCKKRLAFYVCTFVLCVVCNVSYVMCVCVCAVYVLASNVRVHACVFMYVCVCVCIYCWRT